MDHLEYERRLREEVIYLHSLWHQGPPSSATTSSSSSHPHLHLSTSSTQFKKRRNRNPKPKDSGWEWACPPKPEPSPGWPKSTKPQTHLSPPSPRRQAWFLAKYIQFKAIKSVTDFFKSMGIDDDDDEDEYDDDDDDEDMDDPNGALGFFTRLFEEEDDLRELYARSSEEGELSCLVCSGVGKNKTFRDCMALVQHTIAITKRWKEHRAYGGVVCKFLGWNIDNLPSVVSAISAKRNGLAGLSSQPETNPKPNSDNNGDSVDSVNDGETRGRKFNDNEQLPGNCEAAASKDVPFVSGANGSGEDPYKEVAGAVQSTEDSHRCKEEPNTDNKDTAISVADNVDSIKDTSNEEIRGKESAVAKESFDNEIPQSVNDPNGRAEDVKTMIAEREGNTECTVN